MYTACGSSHDFSQALYASAMNGNEFMRRLKRLGDRGGVPVSGSSAEHDETMVELPPLIAAKLALHEAVRKAGLSDTALTERLGVTETVIRRLLDLDHRSHIGLVERALALLGKRLVVEVLEAA